MKKATRQGGAYAAAERAMMQKREAVAGRAAGEAALRALHSSESLKVYESRLKALTRLRLYDEVSGKALEPLIVAESTDNDAVEVRGPTLRELGIAPPFTVLLERQKAGGGGSCGASSWASPTVDDLFVRVRAWAGTRQGAFGRSLTEKAYHRKGGGSPPFAGRRLTGADEEEEKKRSRRRPEACSRSRRRGTSARRRSRVRVLLLLKRRDLTAEGAARWPTRAIRARIRRLLRVMMKAMARSRARSAQLWT